MNRFYHSFWTAPLTNKEKACVFLLCSACSALYVKKNGANIVLHTDKKGLELFGDIPYDDILLTIEDANLNPNIKCFYALGKLVGTLREPLGSVSLDIDVFLKTPQLVESILNNNSDLLVQSVEDDSWKIDDSYKVTQSAINPCLIPEELSLDYPLAYNCGITKFNNKDLKHTYLKYYFSTVSKLVQDEYFYKRYQEVNNADLKKYNGRVVPDIVIEQQFLHELCKLHNYSVDTVLKGDIFKCAESIGYTHLISINKAYQIENVCKLLKYLDLDVYNKVINNPIFKTK